VYSINEEFSSFIREAHNIFFDENALSPVAFPTLRKLEVRPLCLLAGDPLTPPFWQIDVVRMTASMLHGDDNVRGTMTSGGTESLLMAVKVRLVSFVCVSAILTLPRPIATEPVT
jgi:sphinganine-1-phosphate aldolase